jgi:hypothetical protein
VEYVYLSIKDPHDRQYNYMKITIFTLIGMIRLIGFNIQDIQIHVKEEDTEGFRQKKEFVDYVYGKLKMKFTSY